MEAAVANMMAAQGDRILFVTCDTRPRCVLDNFYRPDIDRDEACTTCSRGTRDYLQQTGLRAASFVALTSLVDAATVDPLYATIDSLPDDSLFHFRFEGMPWDEWVVDSLKMAYFGERWQLLPNLTAVTRNTLKSMAHSYVATQAFIDEFRPDSILLINGLIPNERVVWETAKRRGVRTLNYEGGQQPGTLYIDDTLPACFYDVSASWESWRRAPLSRAEAGQVDQMMVKRMYGGGGGYVYSPSMSGSRTDVRTQLDLPADGPLLVAFTNSSADTSVFHSNTVFSQQIDWIDACIQYATAHPHVSLAIRIHPVEGDTRTFREGKIVEVRDKIADGIPARWPELPTNVRVVESAATVSSYDLMSEADVVLAYVSTVGIEAAILGKPVVNAGRYHYTHKGFTHCPETPTDFVATLDRLVADPTPPPHSTELARRYLHLWMVRSMVKVPPLRVSQAQHIELTIRPISDYGRGRSADMDRIVDFIRGQGPWVDPPAAWRPLDGGNPAPLPLTAGIRLLALPHWNHLTAFAPTLLNLPPGTAVTLLATGLSPGDAADRIIGTLTPMADSPTWPELDVVPLDLPDAALGALLMDCHGVITDRHLPQTDRLAQLARHAGVTVTAREDTAAFANLIKTLMSNAAVR